MKQPCLLCWLLIAYCSYHSLEITNPCAPLLSLLGRRMLFSISGLCKYPFRTSPWWKRPSELLDLQPHQVQKENAVRFVLLLRHLAAQGDQSVTASMKDTWVLLFTWTPLLLSDPFPTPLPLHSTSIGHRIPQCCHLELKKAQPMPKEKHLCSFCS